MMMMRFKFVPITIITLHLVLDGVTIDFTYKIHYYQTKTDGAVVAF